VADWLSDGGDATIVKYCLEKELGVTERVMFVLVGIEHKRYTARDGLNAGGSLRSEGEFAHSSCEASTRATAGTLAR